MRLEPWVLRWDGKMAKQIFHVNKQRFGDVRVVLAETDPALRQTLEQHLHKIGFKDILSTDNLDEVKKAIIKGHVDLLVGDAMLEDGALIDLVRAMRLGFLGGNIFPVVISMISNPTQALVNKVINSGPDNILVKPFGVETFCERILQLTAKREPFVVTSDYIGPDRRQKQRPGAMVIPKTQVPNPLHNKVTSFYKKSEFTNYIQRTASKINELRIERQSFQIGYLVERIQPDQVENEEQQGLPPEWRRLAFTARDLANRVKGSQFSHMNGMTSTLINFVDDMEVVGVLNTNDFRLLSQLSQGISRGISLD